MKYRYNVANLHHLQLGHGAPVPFHPSTRIQVHLKQLDHFLFFITSPHLIQDLPFRQKHLTLSTGQVIEVSNVIRTMIPQRILCQYTQYCHKTGLQPFRQWTILCILLECSASGRKSFQRLDYYATKGTKAFKDLMSLVRKLNKRKIDMEWQTRTTEYLRAAKLYLNRLSRNINVSADLQKLPQLESSASQSELVQAIHVKSRLPRKNTKRQCHFKQLGTFSSQSPSQIWLPLSQNAINTHTHHGPISSDCNGDIGRFLPWDTEHCKSSEFMLKAEIKITVFTRV